MRIFSGIRSSGDKTLGNYSGGFRQYVATQEQGDAFFCVVDLHSITTPFEPEVLHKTTLPIGDDQRQHLELARNIAERFNGRFGAIFKIPEAVSPEEGARIKNPQEPER